MKGNRFKSGKLLKIILKSQDLQISSQVSIKL